jgi:hypothetical protein
MRGGDVIRGLLLALALGIPSGAVAAPSVVLLPAELSDDQLDELRGALQAHLSAWQVEVTLAEAESPVAELWLTADGHFGILTPALSDEPILRAVPDTGEGWAARCEVMGTVARSVLEPVLAGTLPEAIETLDETDDDGDAPAVAPREDGGIQTRSPARRPHGAHLAVTAGYAPTILSGQGPYLHGATVGLGVGIGRHLEFGAEFALVETADLNVPTSDVALGRWPVRVHAAGIVGSDRLDLALKLGAVIEIWRIRDLDYETVAADLGELQTDAGFTVAARARLKPLPWLAPYAEIGVDLYPSTNRYLYLGNTQLRRSAAQPRVVVGLMVLLGPR